MKKILFALFLFVVNPVFAGEFDNAFNFYQKGEYNKALKEIEHIEAKGNKTAGGALLKFEIYKQQNRPEMEKRALKEAIELDPDCYEGIIALGVLYLEDFDTESAKKYFNQALGANPNLLNSAEILYYFAQICIMDKDFDLAYKNIMAALEQDSFEPYYYLELGKIYLYKKDYLHAINSFEYVLGENPEINEQAYNYIGVANYKRGNLKTALEDFKAAVLIKPSIINLSNLAMCYKSLLDDENYKLTIEKMNQTTPTTAEDYLQFSQLLYDKKQPQLAFQTLQEGLKKFPHNILLKAAVQKKIWE